MQQQPFFMSLPYISVIIPCYNCAKTIHEVLTATLNQSYAGSWEVICVDDGSQDTTANVITSFQQVRYFYQENAGPAKARNHGVDQANGDIVVFTDSDCIPDQHWLERLMEGFINQEVGAVAGSYGIANSQFRLARCIHDEILFRHHRIMGQYVRAFGSYNVAISKKVFQKVGGFDTSFRMASGEDNDLSYKIIEGGYQIYFQRLATVKHYHPVSVRRYLFEQYRHGFWRAKLYCEHPQMRGGDDYTNWKDILEVPLAITLMVFVLGCLFFPSLVAPTLSFLVLMFFLETVVGVFFCRRIDDGIYYGSVMLFRALSRTLGFCIGGFKYLTCKNLTKK